MNIECLGCIESTEDVRLIDDAAAEEAIRFVAAHSERLARDRALFDRFNALIRRQGLYIVIRDGQGRPRRLEPSFPLLRIMAELDR